MRALYSNVAAVLLVAAPGVARATPSARLVYSRGHGAESCADEAALRRAVASRVGYDPFFPWAKRTVVAEISAAGARYFARVFLVDERGIEQGSRTLEVQGDCSELLDTAALAIAIAIDPHSLAPRKPDAAALPPPASPPVTRNSVEAVRPGPAAAQSVPLSTALATARVRFEGEIATVTSVGVAPLPAIGIALGGGVRAGRLSLAIEGRIDAPASVPTARASDGSSGVVSSWLAVATLVPCWHVGPTVVCALAQGGSMRVGTDATVVARWNPWWAVGGRFGVDVPLDGDLALRVDSDLLADLQPPSLEVNGQPAWNAPRLAASLAADLVVLF